jgi:6-pyruvoyltetrahydropterin/6-carboxytetrahydropterin synthase
MHKLSRQVRFSINPFLGEDVGGVNSYSSRPAGEGLAVYLSLWVELEACVDADTGFVVNVVQIDKVVREFVVPLFDEKISESYRQSKHVGFGELNCVLRKSWGILKDKFESCRLSRMSLELNPYRKIAIESEDCKLTNLSEKFEFAATHKLWNDSFSPERNKEVFGKCANPAGHGHNYIVEVTAASKDGSGFNVGQFQQVIIDEFISLVDHKNLNVDVDEFSKTIPTVENITTFAWGCLVGKFPTAELVSITIWESDRMYCTFSGPAKQAVRGR